MIIAGMGRDGKNSLESGCDWTEFLQEQAGLVRIPPGMGGISQNDLESRLNW